ncbi:MAG: hypothetical protein R2728_06930 [Chitinophagales bacterium]
MELKELNENSLLLTFERFSLLVGINEDRVNYIEPYSIEDSSFVFSNQYSYGVNNKLDTILIDGENCIDFVVFEQCFWGGKVMQFHFTENYLSSCYQYLYSYEDGFGVESEIVKDTFLFEYTNLSNDEPLPQQMPYAVFSVKNDAAGVFPIAYFDYLHYLLRLAGYKIFEDNKNLKLSENDTDFKYQFNDKGQVIEMEVSYGSNGGQYPTQINTYNFEYYD